MTRTSNAKSEGPTCWGCQKRDHSFQVCKDTCDGGRETVLQSKGNAKDGCYHVQIHGRGPSFRWRVSLVLLLLRFRCLHDSHSSRLLKKLRNRGVSLKENKLDEPMQIDQAVAGRTCIAESYTHLTLRLDTRVGLVLLRGLLVLMILEDMPAILVERDLSTQGTRNLNFMSQAFRAFCRSQIWKVCHLIKSKISIQL